MSYKLGIIFETVTMNLFQVLLVKQDVQKTDIFDAHHKVWMGVLSPFSHFGSGMRWWWWWWGEGGILKASLCATIRAINSYIQCAIIQRKAKFSWRPLSVHFPFHPVSSVSDDSSSFCCRESAGNLWTISSSSKFYEIASNWDSNTPLILKELKRYRYPHSLKWMFILILWNRFLSSFSEIDFYPHSLK